tara:strand:- start:2739 stop:4193 length:1455 start_codon:yes stop_codon:yes gene_type:complete
MKIKYIGLTIILFLISFSLTFKKVNSKELNINDLGIFKYIPNNYEISLISNVNNADINQFVKKNIEKNIQSDLITLRNGIYSFFGFDLTNKFKDIYDGEFALSTFYKDNDQQQILLIIKVKDSTGINNILNLNDDLNEDNKLISISRPEKINFLNYVIKTKDNYIIFSSNKDLINSSINAQKNNHKQNRINQLPHNLLKKIKEEKLLILSNENLVNHTLGENYFSNDQYFLTFLRYAKNTIKLKTTSITNYESINQELLTENLKTFNDESNIFLVNYFNILNSQSPFLEINNIQKKILEGIRGKINNKTLLIGNERYWILVIKNIDDEDNLLDQIKFLNGFNKNVLKMNNNNYSVFSKDRLSLIGNKVFYEKENPIFIKERDNLIFVSNDLPSISNNEMLENFTQVEFSDDLTSESKNLFIDDEIYLNKFSQNIFKYNYPIIKKIKIFISNSLNFKINKFNVKIKQGIPQLNPTIFIESELKIL